MADDLIYLATPYSGNEQRNFELACVHAARLMGLGLHVFAPIPHTHPIAQAGQLPTGWDFWESYDRRILSVCTHLVVATEMDGWDLSKGVAGEAKIARELGVPVTYGVETYLRNHGLA